MRLSKAKREVVSAVRKDTIVGAAGSVLEEHGVDGMTMDRVAAVAGLAKGSLYNYFEDKDDLLRFVYARLIEPFLLSIEEIAHGELAAPEKLERIVARPCSAATGTRPSSGCWRRRFTSGTS